MSAGAVLLAAALYFATAPHEHSQISVDLIDAGAGPSTPGPTDAPSDDLNGEGQPGPTDPEPTTGVTQGPAIDRNEHSVVVLNNSRIQGLAARTAVTLQSLGWDVQDTANWVGVQQPSAVVFYPSGQQGAAEVLAADLGGIRVEPMPSSMPEDRLTVVLTRQ